MRPVPNKAWPTRVSSPNSIPNTAVAANVVALVTGTVREMGVWLRIAKKVTEAERFMKKGTVYCQIERRVSQFLREASILWRWDCCGGVEVDLRAWSHKSAPRRMMALVAPHTRPTATIFSTSPIIFVWVSVACLLPNSEIWITFLSSIQRHRLTAPYFGENLYCWLKFGACNILILK